MIARYQVLQQRLLSEWVHVRTAAQKAVAAYASGGDYAVDAAALSLHSFYCGLERLFELIARQIDDSLPEGAAWHRDLLAQMTLNLPNVRPPVLQMTTMEGLLEFLGFRHVVRNVYAWELEPRRVALLVQQIPSLIEAIESDINAFTQFLDAASHADESAS